MTSSKFPAGDIKKYKKLQINVLINYYGSTVHFATGERALFAV